MTPIQFIRKSVLGMTQTEFANLAGVAQATVSRWESGGMAPSQREMAKIRAAAQKAGKPWNDAWFFEVPKAA